MSHALAGFNAVLSDGYAFFGDPALYTARGVAPAPVTVLIDGSLAQYGEVATVAGKTVAISVRASELAAAPRNGDVFAVTGGEYAGRAFRVDSLISSDALEHKVLCA